MTNQKISNKRPNWVVFLLTIFLLSGCAGSGERLWLNAPDWSRAQLVASTQDDEALAMATAGDAVLLVTVTNNRPIITAFDQEMAALWQQPAAQMNELPTQLSIIWNDAQQTAHLFWLAEERLYTQAITADGQWLTAEPEPLNGDILLGQYAAAADQNGTVHVWLGGTRREPGIYRLTLADPTPELITAEGNVPALFLDSANTLHVTWFAWGGGVDQQAGLYYTAYDETNRLVTAPQLLVETQVYSGSLFRGPYVAADQTTLYIFWSELIRSGRATGVIENEYVTLPATGFTEPPVEIQQLSIPHIETADLPYEPVSQTGFTTVERVPIDEGFNGRNAQLQAMGAAHTSGEEIVLSFRTPVLKERQRVGQVALVYLQDGRATSYQLMTDTFYSSFNPQLAASSADLWLSWSERIENDQFAVYLASTNATTQAALSGITTDDVSRLSAMTITGLLLNAVLTPFVFLVWMIPVLAVLLLTIPLWRQEDTLSQRSAIALGLILLTFWLVKLFTMQGMFAYVPFSQWIPIIPFWLGLILQVVIFVLVPAVSAWAAWRYGREADFQPVLAISIIYILLDTLGTMTFYGELLYNAF